jgi:protein-tyrosine phosphatase
VPSIDSRGDERVTTGLDELSGAWNFRDVAETAGVRPGRFFRSSELSGLSDEGRRLLVGLGITDVADLRSPREVERRGAGAVPAGVEVHLLPFPDVSAVDGEAPHEASFQKMMTERTDDEDVSAAATRFMTEEYERFPTLGGAQRAVRRVVSLLADGRPILAHCFAGKDRTGFTVATVLEAVGVPHDAVLADFLRSNDAVPQLRDRILESLRDRASETPEVVTFAEARLTDAVLGVREEYLDTARRTITDSYGSLAGYLAAAGVTEEDVARLRAQLLG